MSRKPLPRPARGEAPSPATDEGFGSEAGAGAGAADAFETFSFEEPGAPADLGGSGFGLPPAGFESGGGRDLDTEIASLSEEASVADTFKIDQDWGRLQHAGSGGAEADGPAPDAKQGRSRARGSLQAGLSERGPGRQAARFPTRLPPQSAGGGRRHTREREGQRSPTVEARLGISRGSRGRRRRAPGGPHTKAPYRHPQGPREANGRGFRGPKGQLSLRLQPIPSCPSSRSESSSSRQPRPWATSDGASSTCPSPRTRFTAPVISASPRTATRKPRPISTKRRACASSSPGTIATRPPMRPSVNTYSPRKNTHPSSKRIRRK